jgi:chromosome segregation ATPase
VTTRKPPQPTPNTGNTQPSGTCTYQFHVADPKGACAGASSALDKKVELVKQDLDKTKFQYVSQNSMIQSTLARIQSDAASYMTKLTDLNNEIQKLKQLAASAASGTGGSSGNSAALNQMLHDTRDLLTKAISDINNQIFNITLQMQKSAVEETKIQTALNKQINDQTSKIAAAELKLITLENMLKNMQSGTTQVVTMPPLTTTTTKSMPGSSTTTGPPPTAPTGLLNQLKSQLQKLESEVKQVEQSHSKEIKDLTNKADQIKTELNNQTQEIATTKTTSQAMFSKLHVTEQQVQDAINNFTQFQKTVDSGTKILQAEISDTSKNVTTVISSLQQLGTTIMMDKMKIAKNTQNIRKLIPEALKIEQDLQKLNTTVSTLNSFLTCAILISFILCYI